MNEINRRWWAITLVLFGCGNRASDEWPGDPGQITGPTSGGDTTGESGADGDSGQGRLDVPDGGPPPGSGDSGDPGDDCPDVTATITPGEATVVILLDQSGSMGYDFRGITRWNAMYDTLMAPSQGIVTRLQSEVRFGLTFYTSQGGSAGGACPMLVEIPPAFDNHANIDTTYGMTWPGGETPTGESLTTVAMGLDALDAPSPKVVILATDGEPDTCAVPNPQMGQPESIAAAQLAHDLGIRTFVISVGDDISNEHLQHMANAGLGLDPTGTESAPFWKALDATELVDAFETIVGSVASCIFAIDGIVNLDRACEGTVELDGIELDCGAQWHLLDPSTLELLGEACATLEDGETHQVDAQWPCTVISVP